LVAPPIAAPTAALPKPSPGFFASMGWIILLIVFYIAFSVVVCLPALNRNGWDFGWDDIYDSMEGKFLSWISFSCLVQLGMAGLCLRAKSRRLLAFRGIRLSHFFVCLALVFPLSIVAGRAGRFVDEGLRSTKQKHHLETGAESTGHQREADESSMETGEDELARDRPPSILDYWPEEPVVILFLGAVILAPLAEEVFFRGFLGRGLVGRYGVLVGVGLTSLWFGVLHYDYWGHIVGAMLLGIGLHAVYLMTRTIVAPIFIHGLNNSLALLGAFAQQGTLAVMSRPARPTPSLWYAMATAVAAIATLGAILYQTRTRWVLPDGREWSPGYAGAEMPPPDLQAVATCRKANRQLVWVAVGIYIVMWLLIGELAREMKRARGLLDTNREEKVCQGNPGAIRLCGSRQGRSHALLGRTLIDSVPQCRAASKPAKSRSAESSIGSSAMPAAI
jgi:membrane protease YdiL (CAAX protease family)